MGSLPSASSPAQVPTSSSDRCAERSPACRSVTQALSTPSPFPPAPQLQKSKWRSFRTRLGSTVIMISGFTAILYMGHVWVWALIVGIQLAMVNELFQLAQQKAQEASLPGFRLQQWYFFGAAFFYSHIRFLKKNLLVSISNDRTLSRLFAATLKYHTMIAYGLYVAGFALFVLSLKSKSYSYQFGQFAWTHMILMVVFAQTSFFVSNVFEGLIWFVFPCSMVILNDIMAYVFGFFFGRTRLIKLSPKKTWEGFGGAFVSTVIISFCVADGLVSLQGTRFFMWLTCPKESIDPWAFYGTLACEVPQEYVERDFLLPADFLAAVQPWMPYLRHIPIGGRILLRGYFTAAPFQFHTLALSAFASAIAPFGGFFASGFKRAFKIKDFGDSIPGHGGLTDRMDCQNLMAVFSYVYLHTFIATGAVTVSSVLNQALKLSPEQQVELVERLGNVLQGMPAQALHDVAMGEAARM